MRIRGETRSRPNASFIQLLQAAELDSTLKITSVAVDTVLNAWSRQGTLASAARAQDILQRLETMASGVHRPTAFSYATVCSGWAQLGSNPSRAPSSSRLGQSVGAVCKRQDTSTT